MTDHKILKQRFRSSIRRGTGEAHLIMQSHPQVNFSAEIIKASLFNYAYDPQAEGSRAFYISALIALSKQQNKIRDAILTGLANEQDDTWALVQLFDLATYFAKQGDKSARKSIYKRFYKKIIHGSDWCGYTSIIELDGLEGLLFIVTTIGQSIEKNPNNWQDSHIIDYFQKKYPQINAWQEFEKASKENRFIKIYRDNIERTENNRATYQQQNPRPDANYITVTEKINSKAIVPLTILGAKQLSTSDIKKLADDFLQETDRIKLEKYMRVFDKVKYPYDYKPILELAKSRNKKTDRLVEFASGALKYFSGADIRKFAIEILNQTKSPSDYLELLVSNYKKGDSKLLTTIANNCKNEHAIHSVVDGFINIYQANKTKACKEPLEAVYTKLTCGIHRRCLINILIANNVLSKQIKQEMRYDSDEDIRKLG